MESKFTKFISYYQPYLGTFLADLGCAFTAAGISLAFQIEADGQDQSEVKDDNDEIHRRQVDQPRRLEQERGKVHSVNPTQEDTKSDCAG